MVSNEMGDPMALARGSPTPTAMNTKQIQAAAAAGPGHGPAGGGGSGSSGSGEAGAAAGWDLTSASGVSGGPRLLNLKHDLTPIRLVGMVVTEVGLIPPSAVPALLRQYQKDLGHDF